MAYKLVEHRADICIGVWGESVEIVFRDGIAALMDCMGPLRALGKEIHRKQFEIEGTDLTCVFINVLNEVLFLAESERLNITGAEVVVKSDSLAEVTVDGSTVEGFSNLVKAVTFHDANLVKGSDGVWRVRIVLDV